MNKGEGKRRTGAREGALIRKDGETVLKKGREGLRRNDGEVARGGRIEMPPHLSCREGRSTDADTKERAEVGLRACVCVTVLSGVLKLEPRTHLTEPVHVRTQLRCASEHCNSSRTYNCEPELRFCFLFTRLSLSLRLNLRLHQWKLWWCSEYEKHIFVSIPSRFFSGI